MNDFLLPPPSDSPNSSGSESSNTREAASDGIARRKFLKRTGCASAAVLIAWNAETALALPPPPVGSHCSSKVDYTPKTQVDMYIGPEGLDNYSGKIIFRIDPFPPPAHQVEVAIEAWGWKNGEPERKLGQFPFSAIIDMSCNYLKTAGPDTTGPSYYEIETVGGVTYEVGINPTRAEEFPNSSEIELTLLIVKRDATTGAILASSSGLGSGTKKLFKVV